MIYDCFLFFDELELLEIRLNSLAPYVDKFVVCEGEVTFTGKEKELCFHKNKDRFKGFNIIHVVAKDGMAVRAGKYREDAWRREYFQREVLLGRALEEAADEDMILLSDVDEIPDIENHDGREGVFLHKMYYYYFNCSIGKLWSGTVAYRKKLISNPNVLRDRRKRAAPVGLGWHFSTLGSPERISKKIEAFSHQELNTKNVKDKLRENIDKLKDPYGRKYNFTIEMPTGPKWLLENKDRYKNLWYPNN